MHRLRRKARPGDLDLLRFLDGLLFGPRRAVCRELGNLVEAQRLAQRSNELVLAPLLSVDSRCALIAVIAHPPSRATTSARSVGVNVEMLDRV
jgi:hypothetical protein